MKQTTLYWKGKFQGEPVIDDLFMERMVEQIAREATQKIDDLFFERLKEHIPDVDKYNVSKYIHRLSATQGQIGGYPQVYYLDHGTPSEKVLLTVYKPKVVMEGMEARMSQKVI